MSVRIQTLSPSSNVTSDKSHLNVALITRDKPGDDDISMQVNWFGTGVCQHHNNRHSFMVIASPDLCRKGYFLPSPLIYHPDEKDFAEIKIPLIKFGSTDLSLPDLAIQIHPLNGASRVQLIQGGGTSRSAQPSNPSSVAAAATAGTVSSSSSAAAAAASGGTFIF